jgi:hypothetical protein
MDVKCVGGSRFWDLWIWIGWKDVKWLLSFLYGGLKEDCIAKAES